MRNGLRYAVFVGAVIALAGCTTTPQPETRTEYQIVKVAVAAPCVVNRPAPVVPLKEQVAPEVWVALAPGSKAQAVKAQIGERMNYEDRLSAATSGCSEVNPEGIPAGTPAGPSSGPESLLPEGSPYR